MIIYKTTNLISGKIYVGQDVHNNPNYLGSGVYINSAIKKYGRKNFKKETIDRAESKQELDTKEKYWIKFYNCRAPNGYNLTHGGSGPAGYVWTEKQRENLLDHSERMKGENNPAKRPEVRKKLSDNNASKKPEVKKMRAERARQLWDNPGKRLQMIEKMKENHPDVTGVKNPMFGKKRLHSEKTKEKIGKTLKGRKRGLYKKKGKLDGNT